MLQCGARRRCFLSIGIEDYTFRPLKHAEKDAEVLAFKFQTRGSAGLGRLEDGLVMQCFLESLAGHTKLEYFNLFQIRFNYVSIFEEILRVALSVSFRGRLCTSKVGRLCTSKVGRLCTLHLCTFVLRGRRGTSGTGLGLVTRLVPLWRRATLCGRRGT